MSMITRKQYLETIRQRLRSFPVVSVLGPRQVGKTTLAQVIAGEQLSHFFDLEDVDALARLSEPKVALVPRIVLKMGHFMRFSRLIRHCSQ